MPHVLRMSTALFGLLLLAACSTFQAGRDFDINAFSSRVQQGLTTQAQVRSWLGEPSGTGVSVEPDGTAFDQWNYYFAEGSMSDMSKTKTKILQIKFDKQGRVHSYSWSASRQ